MTISFGFCELEVGSAGVDFWDGLFKQAAGRGNLRLALCLLGSTPPPLGAIPLFLQLLRRAPTQTAARIPICSSSYATCVGGTEFNDASNPTVYWNSSNGIGEKSVISFIPEGALERAAQFQFPTAGCRHRRRRQYRSSSLPAGKPEPA